MKMKTAKRCLVLLSLFCPLTWIKRRGIMNKRNTMNKKEWCHFYFCLYISQWPAHKKHYMLGDILSAMEFDKNGDHLAVGDQGGRVMIFERQAGKEVRTKFSEISFVSFKLRITCNCSPLWTFRIPLSTVLEVTLVGSTFHKGSILNLNIRRSSRVMNPRYN